MKIRPVDFNSAMIGKANFAHFAKEASHGKGKNDSEYDALGPRMSLKCLKSPCRFPFYKKLSARLEHPILEAAISCDSKMTLTRILDSYHVPILYSVFMIGAITLDSSTILIRKHYSYDVPTFSQYSK